MGFDKRTFNSRFALRDESIEGILDLATLLKAAIGAAAANWRLVPRCGHLGALKCCNIDQGPLCGLRPQHFDRPMDVSFGPFLLLTQKGQRPGRSAKLPVTALELNGYFFTTLRAGGGARRHQLKASMPQSQIQSRSNRLHKPNAHEAVRDNAIKR